MNFFTVALKKGILIICKLLQVRKILQVVEKVQNNIMGYPEYNNLRQRLLLNDIQEQTKTKKTIKHHIQE